MNAETELHADASSLDYDAILMQCDIVDGNTYHTYHASGKTL